MTLHSDAFSVDEILSDGEFGAAARPAPAFRATPASPARPAPAAPEERGAPADAPVSEAPVDPTAPAQRARRSFRKPLLGAAAAIILAGGVWYGHDYWTVGRFEVSTDDAYVQADTTTIAPKVSGYIGAVLVGDNQTVKAGQPLARIDDRDLKVALEQARADVDASQATVAAKEASFAAQQSTIDAANASLAVDQATETFAGQDDRRYATLATSGWGSVQQAQQASSKISAARAAVARDRAAVVNASKQLDILKAEVGQSQAALAHARAVRDQAELNLSYTTLTAPVDGIVGNRTLRVGQYVQAGTQLMAVVPTKAAYVIANYKETQLADVRPGQKVEISVDMFPGSTFHGRVNSLSPASGQEFALLPPDNATGNFTKVVQRIPVKITLDPNSNSSLALRPGMSVDPVIDTRGTETEKTASND